MKQRIAHIPSGIQYVANSAIIAIVYFAVAQLSIKFATPNGRVSAVWPPSGIAFFALFLNLRYWPAIAVGTFATALTAHVPLITALIGTIGNTLEPVIATGLTMRFAPDLNPFKNGSRVIRFIFLTVLLSCAVGATIGVTALYVTNHTAGIRFSALWKTWMTGDALGMLIVGSFLISLKTFSFRKLSLVRKLELISILALVAFCSLIIFDFNRKFIPELPYAYAILPFIILASYRFQQPGATASVLLISFLSVMGMVNGNAPPDSLNDSLLHLQSFLFITSATALFLASGIAERDEVASALIWSEKKFRSLSENIPCIAYIAEFGEHGRWIYVNRQVQSVLGFTENEIIDQPGLWKSRMHPEDCRRVLEHEIDVQRSGKIFHAEYRFYTKDERMIWIEDEGVLLPEQPTPRFYQGIISDITKRKNQEHALLLSEERYREFFNDDLTGAFISTPDGTIIQCNPAFARMLRFDNPDTVIGVNWFSFFNDESKIPSVLQSLREKKKLENFEESLKTVDGATIHVIQNILGSFDESGSLEKIRGYLFDITERKQLESQLLQSQKMQAIGQLAGGVAHDFNNILMAITGYSDLMELQLEKDHPFISPLSEIQSACKKGASLTRQLLAFGKKQIQEPKVIGINQVLQDMEQMLRRLIREDIELIFKLDSVGCVRMDPGLLEQIIVNITVNARDAMPSGGLLVIQTENFEITDEFCRYNVGATPGKYIVIVFTDTGTGMTEEIKSRIFEPFFTTKKTGEGSGLGLTIVYGIIKHSGGYMTVQSEPAKGTTFRIHLLKTEEAPNSQTNGDLKRVDDSVSNQLILLVDDSEGVRESIATFLELKGFHVIVAGDTSDAIEAAKNNPIDLLITDMVMPKMTGKQLATVLRSTNPDLKILFMSGYTEEQNFQAGEFVTGTDFISKPASMNTIIQKIHGLFLQ